MIRGLKQRSAAERWELLRRQQPPRRALPEIGHSDGTVLQLPADAPRVTPPPFPANTLRDVPPPVPRLDRSPRRPAGPDPVMILDQPESKQKPSIYEQEIKSPADLTRLGSIDPFGDYAPKIPGQQKATRQPKTVWESRRFEQPAFEQFRRSKFENALFTWEPTNVSYNPLYFEDPALERYGHTYHCLLQPAVSLGRFGVQFLGLPYQMAIDPICKEVYPLGWYRPGECAPKLLYQVPLNAEAAGVEAGVMTGLFFLFP